MENYLFLYMGVSFLPEGGKSPRSLSLPPFHTSYFNYIYCEERRLLRLIFTLLHKFGGVKTIHNFPLVTWGTGFFRSPLPPLFDPFFLFSLF